MDDWTPTIPRRRLHNDLRDLTTMERLAIFPREPDLDGTYEGVYEKTGKSYSVRVRSIMGELRQTVRGGDR
jgi:hypothetical protein